MSQAHYLALILASPLVIPAMWGWVTFWHLVDEADEYYRALYVTVTSTGSPQ